MNDLSHALEKRFYESREGLPGKGLGWLDAYRVSGIEAFCSKGFPQPSWESWKYTRLPKVDSSSFCRDEHSHANKIVDVKGTLLPLEGSLVRLVFVNGFFREDVSNLEKLPNGMEIQTIAEAFENQPEVLQTHLSDISKAETSPMVALNAAFMESGVVLRVEPGTRVSSPVEIVCLSGLVDKPFIRHPRNLIIVGEEAQITMVTQHGGISGGDYFTNAVTEISLGNSSSLRHYVVQKESRDSIHLSTTNVGLKPKAYYESFSLATGGRISRSETNLRLNGRESSCNVSGAFLMRGREHCDNTTVIEHVAPDTKSRQVFKGILDDESRGVFQGQIIVHKDAQRTDGHQLSKTLLLSDDCEMDAKPELEIYADDVKCSHGATTGQLDESALFYMRSRGIPEALAKNLLIQSFVGDGLEEISELGVKDSMLDHVLHWLPAHCYLSREWRDG